MLSIISPGVLLVLLAAQLAAQFLGSLKWRPKRLCVSMKGAGRRTTGKNTTSKIAFCQHMQLLPTDVAYGNNRTPRWRFQVWEDRGASPSRTAVIQPCGCWGNWVFPHKSIFFSIGTEAWRHARKLKTTMRFPSGKMPLAKELNSLLHLQAEILPGTLFMLNEDLGGGWPVRMWDVQSSDFHWY